MRKGTEASRRADNALIGAFALVFLLELCYVVPNVYVRPADASVAVVHTAEAVALAGVETATSAGLAAVTPALTRAAIEGVDVEKGCLALAVYYEARGEPRDGQRAVAEVVRNRTKTRNFPKTICGVVLQGMKDPICQFSFACNGAMKPKRDFAAWQRAVRVAEYMLDGPGRGQNFTQGAVYFHADYVAPSWAATKVRTLEVGKHIFYREAPRTREG